MSIVQFFAEASELQVEGVSGDDLVVGLLKDQDESNIVYTATDVSYYVFDGAVVRVSVHQRGSDYEVDKIVYYPNPESEDDSVELHAAPSPKYRDNAIHTAFSSHAFRALNSQ